jgi:hypothetical protein
MTFIISLYTNFLFHIYRSIHASNDLLFADYVQTYRSINNADVSKLLHTLFRNGVWLSVKICVSTNGVISVTRETISTNLILVANFVIN